MSNIKEFPGDYSPDVVYIPQGSEFEFSRGEDYEIHRQEVRDLLSRFSNYDIDRKGIDQLRVFGERYGHENAFDDSYETKVGFELKKDKSRSFLDLTKEHIDYVIMSPQLTLFQKADLLAISAQVLYDGIHVINGYVIVKRELKGLRSLIRSKQSALDHLDDVEKVADETITQMTRTELLMHSATIESGTPVNNVIKAFGILLAVSEQPGPKVQARAEKRAKNKQKLRKARAANKLAKSAIRYSEYFEDIENES